MNKWINVTLRPKFGVVTGNHVGIKVWAMDNQDAMERADNIIDSKRWLVLSAGPTRSES